MTSWMIDPALAWQLWIEHVKGHITWGKVAFVSRPLLKFFAASRLSVVTDDRYVQ